MLQRLADLVLHGPPHNDVETAVYCGLEFGLNCNHIWMARTPCLVKLENIFIHESRSSARLQIAVACALWYKCTTGWKLCLVHILIVMFRSNLYTSKTCNFARTTVICFIPAYASFGFLVLVNLE